jgi:hypothetical protein
MNKTKLNIPLTKTISPLYNEFISTINKQNHLLSPSDLFKQRLSRNGVRNKYKLFHSSRINSDSSLKQLHLETISLSRTPFQKRKFQRIQTPQTSRNISKRYLKTNSPRILSSTEINKTISSALNIHHKLHQHKHKHIYTDTNIPESLSLVLINNKHKYERGNHISNSNRISNRFRKINIKKYQVLATNTLQQQHDKVKVNSFGLVKKSKSTKNKNIYNNNNNNNNDKHLSLSNERLLKTEYKKGSLFLNYFNKVNKQTKKDNVISKKEKFQILKMDMHRSEQRIKDILDSLKRIQHNNDEDLKRKGFVKNVGFLACQHKF